MTDQELKQSLNNDIDILVDHFMDYAKKNNLPTSRKDTLELIVVFARLKIEKEQ